MTNVKARVQKWIFALREGKRDPFREFYAATARPLAAHLHRLGVASQQDLEEVIQETYLEAYKGLSQLQDHEAALAWLMTIGRRQLARHRDRQRRRPGEHRAPGVDESDPFATIVDERTRPADVNLHAKGRCRQIVDLIAGIEDAKRRAVIDLYYLQELSLTEIGARTGVGTSTMTTWLARFRAEAKRTLDDEVRPETSLVPELRSITS